MKICFVTGVFPPHAAGGAQQYVIEVANRLEAEGHRAFVVTTEPYDGVASLRPHKVTYEGIDVWRFFPFNVAHKSTYQQYSLARQAVWRGVDMVNPHAMAMVKRVLDRTVPDVVHVNGLEGISTLASIAVANSDAAYVHTLHDYDLLSPGSTIRVDTPVGTLDRTLANHPTTSGLFTRLQRTLLGTPDVVIGPSQFILDAHRQRGLFEDVPCRRIPHGVARIAEAPSSPPDGPSVLFVGRLAPEKGVETLLAAAGSLPEVEFHLCGTGPLASLVERRADETPNITYHGFVSSDELWSLRRSVSLGVVPSEWAEPFGLVISESYGAGLPVVGSAVGGIPELIKPNEMGALFDPASPDALVSAIQRVLNGDQIAMRMNALDWAREHTLGAHVQSLLDTYTGEVATE
nr:glycosyltransferase [Halococcus saccharolyticus]